MQNQLYVKHALQRRHWRIACFVQAFSTLQIAVAIVRSQLQLDSANAVNIIINLHFAIVVVPLILWRHAAFV
jgi:hypothetical protein